MKYYVVDAFADRVFEGNPAGVCVADAWPDDGLMARVAAENNLSETAFAVAQGDAYGLRWFTPGGEIDLCGHATLATAYIIMRFVDPGRERVIFHTQSGPLTVCKNGELYEMDFPAIEAAPYPLSAAMTEALGVTPLETYKGRDLIFLLEDEEAVRSLAPDFEKLKRLEEGLAVFVTAPGREFDFVSRAFWPKLNVNEDPVCGSMHCSLTPYWRKKLGKRKMTARQLSKRGGTVYVEDCGPRIKLAGRAVLYSTSELHV